MRGRILLAVALSVGSAGCTGGPPTARSSSPPPASDPRAAFIVPREAEVFAQPGRPLVLAVSLRDNFDPSPPIRVALDSGRLLDGELFWVGFRPGVADLIAARDPRGIPARAMSWNPPEGEWSARAAGAVAHDSRTPLPTIGGWQFVIDCPEDLYTAGASAMSIGGGLVPVRWSMPPDAPPITQPQATDSSPWFKWAVSRDAESPSRRWRLALLHSIGRSGHRPGRIADPVLEAMAKQREWRWDRALANLAATSPELASRVVTELTRTVDFGAGVVAPAWGGAVEDPATEELLGVLLGSGTAPSPAAGADRIRRAAQLWLSSRPTAGAWMVQDAAGIDGGTGRPFSMLGLVNLRQEGGVTVVRMVPRESASDDPSSLASGASPTEELFALEAASARVIPCTGDLAPPALRDPTAPMLAAQWAAVGTEVVVSDGRGGELRRHGLSASFPVAPPGFTMGPFRRDWTMDAWLAAATAPDDRGASARVADLAATPIEPEWLTAATLLRDGGSWVLYIEAKAAAAPAEAGDDGLFEPAAARDFVRVWVGPVGLPTAILRVTPDGAVTDDLRVGGAVGGVGGRPSGVSAKVARSGDRWSAWMPLPQEPGNDGLLIGLERVDARGVHSAWPRAMLPWQDEPGRIRLDLSAWSGLDAALGTQR